MASGNRCYLGGSQTTDQASRCDRIRSAIDIGMKVNEDEPPSRDVCPKRPPQSGRVECSQTRSFHRPPCHTRTPPPTSRKALAEGRRAGLSDATSCRPSPLGARAAGWTGVEGPAVPWPPSTAPTSPHYSPETGSRSGCAPFAGRLGQLRPVVNVVNRRTKRRRRFTKTTTLRQASPRLTPHPFTKNNPERSVPRICPCAVRACVKVAPGQRRASYDLIKSIAVGKKQPSRIRVAAARALGKSNDASASDTLLGLLNEREAGVSAQAIDSLAALKARSAVDPLVGLLTKKRFRRRAPTHRISA
jgi:hypothetical protein